MKRTKNIMHSRFRKVHTFWKYSAIFVAISAGTMFLTGCDQDEKVSVYQTVQDCEYNAANQEQKNRCALDYQNALSKSESTAPKYKSQSDCEDEFGANQCQPSHSNSSFMWFPLMHGYSSSNANYSSQPLYSSTRTSSPMYNKFVDAKGNSFGAFKHSGVSTVSRSSLAAKPAVTTTSARGGFGSTVSRSAAVHTSSHSSSHSFGG